MKKIYINEDKLRLIADSIDKKDEEVTFEKFLTKIKEHLSNVLDNAMSMDVDGFFTDHGLSRELLMNKLLDRGILKKTENFKEEYDDSGKKRSMHYVKYSVPRPNFERNVNRLYQELFKCKVNECDCGGVAGAAAGGDFGVSAGANNAAGSDPSGMGSGQFITPLFGVQRRKIYDPRAGKKKKKKNGKK